MQKQAKEMSQLTTRFWAKKVAQQQDVHPLLHVYVWTEQQTITAMKLIYH